MALVIYRIVANATERYRNIILGSIAVLSIWSIVSILIMAFQCRPLFLYWDTTVKGECLASSVVGGNGIAIGVMDMLFSWFYAILPVPLIWRVQLSGGVKISLTVVLCLGVL